MADWLPPQVSQHSATNGVQPTSLPELQGGIRIPRSGFWVRQSLAFPGPGYSISLTYMDPGDWSTDIAGGAQCGMTLLSIVLLSDFMAVLLQAMFAPARHRLRAGLGPGLPG